MNDSGNPEALHVAIIMDGNGRWAQERGWPRTRGHRAGAEAVRRVIEASPSQGIRHLTLYAFSADNWQRPQSEVATLMGLFRRFLESETPRCVQSGVRLSIIGRRDRLDRDLVASIESAQLATGEGTAVHVQIAIDYSARQSIVRAAASFPQAKTPDEFAVRLAEANNADADVPPVDLLIRTGREKRLSDFLLWESAYAELYFSDRMWPEFDGLDLAEAVQSFRLRERRFGGIRFDDAGSPESSPRETRSEHAVL